MAGIYVHIPFCRKACHYCNFHFTTTFNKKDELMSALLAEIKLQAHYLNDHTINTIYFGGGTPSALPPADIDIIIKAIYQHHSVSTTAEVTLEANPDDINTMSLESWKNSGVNRLSIGIQAFQDELLSGWNRNHTADQAKHCIGLSQQAGFHNITADLIYGGNGLTDIAWIQNIETLIDSGIPHVSAYALTVEKNTVLADQIKKGKSIAPDDEQSSRQYSILQNMLSSAGYEQYEISNFAKEGFRSRHNTSYWNGSHYLGLGPSAHSYNGTSRQWNVSNNVKYTHALRHEKFAFEVEVLSDTQRYNEIVMTGLRTSDGISMTMIKALNNGFEEHLKNEALPFISAGKIFTKENSNLALRPDFYFFADGIAAELFRT